MLRRTLTSRFVNPMPGLGRLNHVAIAVPKNKPMSEVAALYADVVGAKVSEPQDLPEHGVTTVFIDLPNTKLELLHPLGDKSPIQSFLDKNPSGGMHHVCLEVEDISKAIERVTKAKVRTIGKEPKIGAHGKPVIFLHPKDCGGVLVELEQV
uniref:Methylmalonyl-CoA epimerase, mitochondrial n=1 Tax=Neobodo designis TaxID=312471 RepID=A0A7S1Q389_NEODS|mmetsp:Transcript_31450/g.97155  ORF Transcript_31450/g.97155 Transcript_31450/m.97155 type:complete len:152 (+) Transcript_31450:41-496(+)